MNPAALLHARLTEYRDSGTSKDLRSRWRISGDDSGQVIVISDADRVALLEAADWLRRLPMLIDALERDGHRVAVWRRYYPIWVNSVFAIGLKWDGMTYTPEEICPQAAMDMLDGLAGFLDMLPPGTQGIAHDQLLALVNLVSEGLDTDDTLSKQLRVHLRRVVDHLRDCVQHPEAYDLRDTAQAADDVLTAAKAAAGESTHTEWKGRWAAFRDTWVAPTVTGIIAGGTSLGLPEAVEYVQHLIGS